MTTYKVVKPYIQITITEPNDKPYTFNMPIKTEEQILDAALQIYLDNDSKEILDIYNDITNLLKIP